jgi:putative salt-induced outer membrane protein YdiY
LGEIAFHFAPGCYPFARMKHWLLTGIVSFAAISAATTSFAQSTNKWEKSASAGLTLTKGNSDTLTVTADILAARKWSQEELNLGASLSYGENTGVKNNETARAFGQFNHLFTERFYGYLRGEALHDAVADVEYRVTLSPGVGYYFIKNETTRLSGEVGPGMVIEKQGRTEKTYFTARLAEKFDHKLSDRARIWQSVEFLPQIDDLNNYIINAEVGVESAITKKLSLRVYAQDTYDREPAPGRKQNDIKLVSALAWKF